MGQKTEAPESSIADGEPQIEKDVVRRYALISVSDKTGVADLAQSLIDAGYAVISTGGTGRALTEEGIEFTPIEEITGNPESFDGRMKTISFPVEGGILYDRTSPKHVAEALALNIPQIEVVVCNLYPFEQTVQKPGVTEEEIVENIDVGGPTMVRAAAKNFKNVLVAIDPRDYDRLAQAISAGDISNEFRQELAAKAFDHLAFYDAQIGQHLRRDTFPQEMAIPLRRGPVLRYGDNPGQEAVWYIQAGKNSPLPHVEQLAGRGLSETNITDIQAGIMAVRLHEQDAAVIIKHNSPCGMAVGDDVVQWALQADPESAFGGVVVLNRAMTMADVEAIAQFKEEGRGQMDIIATPSFEEGVVEALTAIRKTTGVYAFGDIPRSSPDGLLGHWIDGGIIYETENDPEESFANWRVMTGEELTKEELYIAQVGWKIASRIRSNTMVVMDSERPMTRGIGSGQTSRVRSAEIALEQAGEYAKGAILISDGFIPMIDTIDLAKKHGIKIIVQPGGSIRDKDVIEAAKEAGITLIFTSERTFWHQ